MRVLRNRKKLDGEKVHVRVSEEVPENVVCCRLQDGTKIYYREGQPNEIFLESTTISDDHLPHLPIRFAGEVDSMIYFYTVADKSTNKLYTFYEFACSNAPTPIDFRQIGTLATENDIKLALHQPYFFDPEEDGMFKKFGGEELFKLTRANSGVITGIKSFKFLLWRPDGPAVIVKRNEEEKGTIVTRELFYNRQLCVIAVQHDLPMPNSVYVKEFLYMLCGATLFVFRDNLSFSTYHIDPPFCHIGGVGKRQLFLNALRLFFSHELSDKRSRLSSDTKYRRMQELHQLQQTKLLWSSLEFKNTAHRQYSSRFAKEYEVKQILGIGGGGCVFKAMSKLDLCYYAVKRVAVHPLQTEVALGEVRKMAKLDHPGVIRYLCTWIEDPPEEWQYFVDRELLRKIESDKFQLTHYNPNSVFIYMQMQLGQQDLTSWLIANRTPASRSLPRMKSFFKQIVAGVKHLHDKDFIHRDLKPCNVILTEDYSLKICDMGIVVEKGMENGHERTIACDGWATADYASPEQRLILPSITTKSDVFTLGLMLTELCVVMDHNKKVEVFDDVRKGTRTNVFGKDLKTGAFVEWLTHQDKNMRPSCQEILEDGYLA